MIGCYSLQSKTVAPGETVQVIQTTSSIEARTCRRAQFSGQVVVLNISGMRITGLVHSVKDDLLVSPPRWTVSVVLKTIPKFKTYQKSKSTVACAQ